MIPAEVARRIAEREEKKQFKREMKQINDTIRGASMNGLTVCYVYHAVTSQVAAALRAYGYGVEIEVGRFPRTTITWGEGVG